MHTLQRNIGIGYCGRSIVIVETGLALIKTGGANAAWLHRIDETDAASPLRSRHFGDMDATGIRFLLVMSKKMASIVIGYGVALAGLAVVLQQVAPALAQITFIAGLVAGGLTVLWGVVAWSGYQRRSWAVLTLIALALVTLTQVVHAWAASAGETPGKLAGALLLTLLMVMTVGMLMYLLHGERTPEFYRTTPARRNDQETDRKVESSHGGRMR